MRRAILCILFLCVALSAFAADPKIDDLYAVAGSKKVSVRFRLADAFHNGDLVQALQSGLPTSLTYIVEIFRDRPNWFDDGIARARIEVICTFNSLTREYLVNYRRDKKLVRSETFTDLPALEKAMTAIEERDLFDIAGRKAHKLRVRVKADLMRGWVLYVIPWEVSTHWRETRVVAAPEPKS